MKHEKGVGVSKTLVKVLGCVFFPRLPFLFVFLPRLCIVSLHLLDRFRKELHAHLSGSISEASLRRRLGADAAWHFSRANRSLEECFAIFGLAHACIRDPSSLRDITSEVLFEFQNEDSCSYVELRTTPRRFVVEETKIWVEKRTYVMAVLEAMEDMRERHGLCSSLLVSIDRSKSMSVAVHDSRIDF